MRALSNLCVVLTVSVNVLPSDASIIRAVFGGSHSQQRRNRKKHLAHKYKRPTTRRTFIRYSCEAGFWDASQKRELCIPFRSNGLDRGSEDYNMALLQAQSEAVRDPENRSKVEAFTSTNDCPSVQTQNILRTHLPGYDVCAIFRLAQGLELVLSESMKSFCSGKSDDELKECLAQRLIGFLLPNSGDVGKERLHEELTAVTDGGDVDDDDGVQPCSLVSLLIKPDDRAKLIPEYVACFAIAVEDSNPQMEDACANMLVESTRDFFSWE